MDRALTNTVQTLTITGYTGQGAGVARLSDGMVVFVTGAVAGETCAVRITKVGRSAAYGVVADVEMPSPARRERDCPYYGQCGGCVWRHLSYEEELNAKRAQVADALKRIGGLDLPVHTIIGAEHPERYRNKAQFPVGEGAKIGFYRARTHSVVNVGDCLLQKEASLRLRGAVRGWMKANSVPAYDEKTGKGLLRHVFVRTNRAGDSLCCLLVNGEALPDEAGLVEALRAAEPKVKGVVLGVNRRRDNVILGHAYRTIWGEDTLTDTLCGLTFRLSVPSFYQVNPDQTEALYAKAVEFAGLTGGETVLDLYCGIGTIGLCMAAKAGKVYGAEVVPQAVENARENAARNGIENAEFFCGDAGEAARMLADRGVRPDVVCVDPPRKGLSPDVIGTVAEMAPRRVVYVSCDPATLARDLARFDALGYRAEEAVAVDLFPRTAHVETVCLLSKLNTKQHIEVEVKMDELDLTSAESKAIYEEIKEYVLEHTGLKVSHRYIAQVKRKNGIIERASYNLPKNVDAKQPVCPPEKEKGNHGGVEVLWDDLSRCCDKIDYRGYKAPAEYTIHGLNPEHCRMKLLNSRDCE